MSIRAPRATYRVQLNPQFDFAAAAQQAAYLAELGISHLYCSPVLQSAPGSQHGYDVVNHHQVSHELGGETGFAALTAALRQHGLSQVLDVVPNHMAITGRENPWWWDVLEHGPASRYATYFDVDWNPPSARHVDVVLVPVLGDHYGRVLDERQIQVKFDERNFLITYFDHIYPVDPNSTSNVLAAAVERNPAPELAFLAGAFGRLPHANATDRESARLRYQDKEVLYDLLERLVHEQPAVHQAILEAVAQINESADLLDVFLELQNYRLAYWRISQRELGYRRFFDINTLIGLHMDDELVYLDTHGLIFGWLADGSATGLRIDHPDGLRDPAQYVQRLRAASPDTWIVVEKILETHERLPADWPVQGTTGYDFLNRVNGLQVDASAEGVMTDIYTQFTGQSTDYDALVREKKLAVAADVLGSDLAHLTALFLQVCENNRRYRDYTRGELRATLAETSACLPVYRSYVRPDDNAVSPDDELVIKEAITKARENRPDLDPALFGFLGDLLLLHVRGDLESELVQRFQQFTGPVMAKGVEDTLFYNFNRLVSLNEVGGSPGQFGTSLEHFHRYCQQNQESWPLTMLNTSTHDTKRSEDVRARLNVLSEMPEAWQAAVLRWREMNEPVRASYPGGETMPDRNDEYLLYQTLVGAWPIEVERIQRYMQKAVREAKRNSTWSNPNQEYETAVETFIQRMVANSAFRTDLEAFVNQVTLPGRINSLAQTLLKLTLPGVPDIYQGSEIWSLNLVDPDNRRPVDYALRALLLRQLASGPAPEEVLAGMENGLPKLWVIRQALAVRRKHPRAFGEQSSYTPIAAPGDRAVAFTRGETVLVVVPRLVTRYHHLWPETCLNLPAGPWTNVFTQETMQGGEQTLANLLARFPVGLWVKAEPAGGANR